MTAELRGPDNSASSGSALYQHTQSVVATQWTIPHNLGHYPAGVAVRLNSGDIVIPDRDDLDINTVVLSFIVPAAGIAELV